jgi:hypothetical protein
MTFRRRIRIILSEFLSGEHGSTQVSYFRGKTVPFFLSFKDCLVRDKTWLKWEKILTIFSEKKTGSTKSTALTYKPLVFLQRLFLFISHQISCIFFRWMKWFTYCATVTYFYRTVFCSVEKQIFVLYGNLLRIAGEMQFIWWFFL